MTSRHLSKVSLAAVAAAFVSLSPITGASALTVAVNGQAGPWSQTVNPTLNYGVGDNLAPTMVGVLAGGSITIQYVSGATSAFGGVPPTVDANGYVGLIFGSGAPFPNPSPPPPSIVLTGIGSSGNPLPSFFIDPTNSGPDIWLNELIGAFADSSGKVVGNPFAVGDGPLTMLAPGGATLLLLGVNDDIYIGTAKDANGALIPDNTGSLDISVTGDVVATTPLPAALPLFATGLGGLGLLARRRKRKTAAIAA